METTKKSPVQFDPIYITSLKSVVNIYQSKIYDNKSYSSQIAKDFGLPLSIASVNNEVIGYAFVLINKTGEPEINSYWEKEFYTIEAEKDLKFHAQNIFQTVFKDPETRTIKIQNATERLSNWLNVCN
jgi:hypothetical protein